MDEVLVYKSKPKNDELGNIVKPETNCFHMWVNNPINLKKVRVVLYENYIVITRLKNAIHFHIKRETKSSSPKLPSPHPRNSKQMAEKVFTSKSSVLYLPVPLTWLIMDKNIDQEQAMACQILKKSTLFAFSLVWPEGNLILATPLEKDRNDWVASILSRLDIDKIVEKEDELWGPSEKRFGIFTYESGGTYRGQWRNGRPHGQGKYTDQNLVYNGYWHGDFCTGRGTVINITTNKSINTGWLVNLPEPIQDKPLDEDITLTPSDTEQLIRTGITNSFQKGDIILREGEISKNMWWVQRGTVSLKKYDHMTKQTKFLGSLGPSSFFGELSLIDKRIMSFTVVADSDVEITLLNLQGLLNLFQSQSDVAKRFYRTVAICLANRFVSQFELKNKIKEEQPNVINLTDTWNKLRRQITYSGMLLSTAVSKTLDSPPAAAAAEELEKPTEVDPLPSFSKKFMQTWTDGKHEELMPYFSKNIIYLDPYIPSGCQGYNQLSDHLTMLLPLYSGWRWDIEEFLPLKDEKRCTLRVRIYTEKLLIKLWGMVLLSVNGIEITQCEIYFDRKLLQDKLPAEQPKEMSTDTAKAMEFRRKFGLTALDEILFAEYTCKFTIPSLMELESGSLYVSSRHICFLSQMFKFEVRKVIPVSLIKSMTPIEKTLDRSGTFKIVMAKDGDIFTLTFNPPEIAETAYKTITAVISSSLSKEISNPEIIPKNDASDYILSWVKLKRLVIGLPKELKIRPVTHIGRGIRLEGPRKDLTPSLFGTEICGKSISNYPYKSIIGPDGKRIIDEKEQEGMPICDQFCIERYENQTIFALADGCNWGIKPKHAAHQASRRFVEFMSMHQSAILSVGDGINLCFEGISSANTKIMEESSLWWEKGTTTLIGGAIVMTRDDGNAGDWALIAAGVGDCKIYHYSVFTDHVEADEITVGSRNAFNILDPTDPGGRLGPFVDKMFPDLRNLNCWFRRLRENDVIMICTDGVHDNFDPQLRGISSTSLGLTADWDKCDMEEVVKVKSKWTKETLSRVYDDLVKNTGSTYANLSMEILTEYIITICQTVTEPSRQFMQQYPEKALPDDYQLFPGKLDHCTCICIRVLNSSLQYIEQMLDSFVLRMRHPANGLPLHKWSGGDSNVSNHKFVFSGRELVQWFIDRENTPDEAAQNMGQLLQNFKYIRRYPTLDSNWCESFAIEALYEFQGYEPSLLDDDWKYLSRVGKLMRLKKNYVIVQQTKSCEFLYQIIKGVCRVTVKSNKENSSNNSTNNSNNNSSNQEPEPPKEDQNVPFLVNSNPQPKNTIIPILPTQNLLSLNDSGYAALMAKQQQQQLVHSPRTKTPPSPSNRTLEKKNRISGFKPTTQRDKSPVRFHSTDVDRSPRSDEITISILKENEIFGEVGFMVKNAVSNVSIIADTDCEVFQYDREMLELLFLRYPEIEARFYQFICMILSQRLKSTE